MRRKIRPRGSAIPSQMGLRGSCAEDCRGEAISNNGGFDSRPTTVPVTRANERCSDGSRRHSTNFEGGYSTAKCEETARITCLSIRGRII